MAWLTAVSDLRTKLSDNTTDRLRAFKRVFGDINGTNLIFKTFEYRRITDFTTASAPLGVYKNGVRISSTGIMSDDLQTGYFTLQSAPLVGDVIEATYYCQYFLDSELQSFLRLASNFIAGGDNYTQAQGGLQTAVLAYAAAEAYQKLALRFADTFSDTYKMQDLPDAEREKIIVQFKKSSEEARTEAMKLRNDFYENRQGQALAPLFGTNLGNVRDVAPNR
ncbi:hypothetical protein EBT16_04140 [bacterium]|nr:hypothetical protein [bacterium]